MLIDFDGIKINPLKFSSVIFTGYLKKKMTLILIKPFYFDPISIVLL